MINIELVPVKYITGTYKYDKDYPTSLDLLWDIVNIGKSTIAIDKIDWIDSEKRDELIKKLNGEYINISGNNITIIKTDWGWKA